MHEKGKPRLQAYFDERENLYKTQNVYENWDQISAVSEQFVTDIQNDMHHNTEWLDKNIQGITQLACNIFLAQRVAAKINRSKISQLINGFKQQKVMPTIALTLQQRRPRI
jgi:hypothetical protein